MRKSDPHTEKTTDEEEAPCSRFFLFVFHILCGGQRNCLAWGGHLYYSKMQVHVNETIRKVPSWGQVWRLHFSAHIASTAAERSVKKRRMRRKSERLKRCTSAARCHLFRRSMCTCKTWCITAFATEKKSPPALLRFSPVVSGFRTHALHCPLSAPCCPLAVSRGFLESFLMRCS